MKVKTITIPFNQECEQFADEELEAFLSGKHVLAMQEHFFQSGGRPCITFIIRYLDEKPAGHLTVGSRHASTEKFGTKDRKNDWKEILQEDAAETFRLLREWRNEIAKNDGIPPYVICNNRLLAQIANAKPDTLEGLGKLPGFGEGKLKRYGQEILELLRKLEPSPMKEEACEQLQV